MIRRFFLNDDYCADFHVVKIAKNVKKNLEKLQIWFNFDHLHSIYHPFFHGMKIMSGINVDFLIDRRHRAGGVDTYATDRDILQKPAIPFGAKLIGKV